MKTAYVLFGALFTIAVAVKTGRILLSGWARENENSDRGTTALEESLLSFVTGSAVLSLAVFLILALHLGYKGVFLATGVGVLAASYRWGRRNVPQRQFEPLPGYLRLTYGIPMALFTVYYVVNAMAPELSPDGASYHLSFVARYLREHAFTFVPYNMYSHLSQGVEMLFVHAFAFGRHSAAALVHFAFLVTLALMILSYGRRMGHAGAGATASLMVYASPVVGIDAISAYVDVAAACVMFSVFYLIQIWDERRSDRLLWLAGLLGGFAFAAKYTAVMVVPYAAGFVWWRTRRLRPAAALLLFSLISIAPWTIKNAVLTGNPVLPMANRWFPNAYVHVSFEREWLRYLSRYELASKWEIPWQLTVKGDKVSGQIGPWFLLLPLALLAARTAEGRRLLVPALLFSAPYFSNVGARFAIPALPFWALAMAQVLRGYPRVLAGAGVLTAILGWPWVLDLYTGRISWRPNPEIPWKAALRLENEEAWLVKKHPEYVFSRLIEDNTPAGARVLGFNGIPESYTTREYAVAFQSAPGEALIDIFYAGNSADQQPVLKRSFSFAPREVKRIRVVQTGDAKVPEEEWMVHEVRLLSGDKEIPRRSDWRLKAYPNPWEVQMAFDNSAATRWRGWESLRHGSFIEATLYKAARADGVVLECAATQKAVRLQLEIEDAAGKRETVTKLTDTAVVGPGHQGRAAMGEVKARGFDYVMLRNPEFNASEVAQNPAGWGLEAVAHAADATLYRIKVPGPPFEEMK